MRNLYKNDFIEFSFISTQPHYVKNIIDDGNEVSKNCSFDEVEDCVEMKMK